MKNIFCLYSTLVTHQNSPYGSKSDARGGQVFVRQLAKCKCARWLSVDARRQQRITMQNHLEAAKAKENDNFVIKRLTKEYKRLLSEEKEVLQSMLELVDNDAQLKTKFESITSFKGIGPTAGLALLHLFLSYPNANRKQITALCGLDVVVAESGTSLRRKGRISKKGSRMYRGILFMATMISIQHNPSMKAFYDRLKENGKHSTAAQIAVMRKIVLITHSLFKNESVYQLPNSQGSTL